jgi:hypothetical protein
MDCINFERQYESTPLKVLGIYPVVTPDKCVALGRSLDAGEKVMIFNAMRAGLREEVFWESLKLFAAKVLPRLRATTAAPDPLSHSIRGPRDFKAI